MRIALVILLLIAASAHAAKGGRAQFTAVQSGVAPGAGTIGGSSHAGGGGYGTRYDPRTAPPLDPARKVNEQDCSKPVDLAAGNLKCK
jgi:hypothetical protein